MAHTNMSIPRRFGEIDRMLTTAKAEAELKFWKETAEWFLKELENIPEAIEKYGYVTLPDGTKLVPDPSPTQEP
jgi:hypothetical protein